MLATLWIGFLLIAFGIDSHTWYLLGVGALGMLHNVFVAGWHRDPEAHGIPLRPPIEDPGRLQLEVELGRRKRDAGRQGGHERFVGIGREISRCRVGPPHVIFYRCVVGK